MQPNSNEDRYPKKDRMRIFQITLLSLLVLSLNACSKVDLNEDVPNCIEKKIKKISNDPVQNPAAEVWKWEDDVNTYYYFTCSLIVVS